MKKIIFFSILFLFQINLFSQITQDRVDSLLQYNSKLDIEKNSIEYLKNIDTILFISEKLYYKKGIAYAQFNLAYYYYLNNKYDEALIFFRKSYSYFKEKNNLPYIISLLNYISYIYFEVNYIDSALSCYNQLEQIYKQKNDLNSLAQVLINMGNAYSRKSMFSKSLESYYKSLEYSELIKDSFKISNNYINIGLINRVIGNTNYALDFMKKGLNIALLSKNKAELPLIYFNLAKVYSDLNYFDSAIVNFNIAYKYAEKNQNLNLMASNLGEIANLYHQKMDFSKAYELYLKSLELYDSLNNQLNKAFILVYLAQINLTYYNNLDSTLKQLNYASIIAEEYDDKNLKNLLYKAYYDYYKKVNDYKNALIYLEKLKQIKDEIYPNQLLTETGKFISKYEMENRIKENIRRSQEEKRISFIIGLTTTVVTILIIIFGIITYKQKKKTDNLLLNILPYEIANKLKENKTIIADYFKNVCVIFIDIVNFTKICNPNELNEGKRNYQSPSEIVKLLNDIFTIFDNLAEKYSLEKIKTIGDCYMAASGIPSENENYALNIANFAIEAIKLNNFEYKFKNSDEKIIIQFRCGIHIGPVVAGVIGKKKFVYDLWGDTVNIAERLESSSLPNKIQISEELKNVLEQYKDTNFAYFERGYVEMKGIGKIKTWFLENKKNIGEEMEIPSPKMIDIL